jgi:preprotein translocase subunit SecA
MNVDPARVDRDSLAAHIEEELLASYAAREEQLGEELMRALERFLLLEIIDQRWQEHLYDMDYLREGIHLRGVGGQLDPLVAYKNEAFELFKDLMHSVWEDFAKLIFHVEVQVQQDPAAQAPPVIPQRRPSANASSATGGGRVTYSGGAASAPSPLAMAAAAAGAADEIEAEEAMPHVEQRRVDESEQIGRNDPCWCGSGKKYKKCHGA